MKRERFLIIAVMTIIFIATACSNEQSWKDQENQEISDFLKNVPDTAYVLKPSGLYYFETITGTGVSPVTNDVVYFRYAGRFLNGVAFDSISLTQSLTYEYLMGSMTIVAGVDEGLRYMKVGGKSLLLTPSDLAYGRQGLFTIVPGYKPLLWEVVLDSVKVHTK